MHHPMRCTTHVSASVTYMSAISASLSLRLENKVMTEPDPTTGQSIDHENPAESLSFGVRQ